MSPGHKRLYFALACAAIGFFVVASFAPRGGAHGSRWIDDVFGLSGFALGAVGAGVGLVVGVLLASLRSRVGRSESLRNDPIAVADPLDGRGPGEQKRQWLRARRKRNAPKRFGKPGR